MPGDDSSDRWFVRVTITETNSIDRVEKFAKNYPAVKLVVAEKASQEHVHVAVVPEKSCSRNTVMNYLKKHFDLTDKSGFALTLPKINNDEGLPGLYRYMCKGTGPEWETQQPKVVYNLLNLINVKQYHADYWHQQEEVVKAKKTAVRERLAAEQKTKKAVIAELIVKYKDIGKDGTIQVFDQIVMDVYKAYKGDIREDTLHTASNAIYFGVAPDAALLQAVERMRRKTFVHYRT